MLKREDYLLNRLDRVNKNLQYWNKRKNKPVGIYSELAEQFKEINNLLKQLEDEKSISERTNNQ